MMAINMQLVLTDMGMYVVLLSRRYTTYYASQKRSLVKRGRSYTTYDGRSDSDSGWTNSHDDPGRTDLNGQSSYDDSKECSIRYEILPDETNDCITKDMKYMKEQEELREMNDMNHSYNYKDNNIIPFCWLDRVAYAIGMAYQGLPSLFNELTPENVISIQKRLKDGTYTLSPIIVRAFPKNVELSNVFYKKIHIKDEPNFYLCFNHTLEDSLVLMGIGIILNHYLINEKIFMDKSVGLRVIMKDFYGTVCAIGNVFRLYKVDLTNSIRIINRDSLLCKLSHIVKDGDIMELVSKFMYLPILDESGIDLTAQTEFGIPPSGYLSEVLLNFALTEFDKEFMRVFPELDYNRYVHEVVVSLPNTCTSSSKQGNTLECEDLLELQVEYLLEQLHLAGKIISIKPGDAPVPCYGGTICVSQDGLIQVKVKEKKEL